MTEKPLTPDEEIESALLYSRLLVEGEFRELSPDETLFLIIYGARNLFRRETENHKN